MMSSSPDLTHVFCSNAPWERSPEEFKTFSEACGQGDEAVVQSFAPWTGTDIINGLSMAMAYQQRHIQDLLLPHATLQVTGNNGGALAFLVKKAISCENMAVLEYLLPRMTSYKDIQQSLFCACQYGNAQAWALVSEALNTKHDRFLMIESLEKISTHGHAHMVDQVCAQISHGEVAISDAMSTAVEHKHLDVLQAFVAQASQRAVERALVRASNSGFWDGVQFLLPLAQDSQMITIAFFQADSEEIAMSIAPRIDLDVDLEHSDWQFTPIGQHNMVLYQALRDHRDLGVAVDGDARPERSGKKM